MLKPKHINIKKICSQEKTQTTSNKENNKNINSRKSLKIPKQSRLRQASENKPSPIEIMKKNTLEDERQSRFEARQAQFKYQKDDKRVKHQKYFQDQLSSDHSDFIACINGYLNQLSSTQASSQHKHTNMNLETIQKKIQKEKQINRSLHKNVVAFQKVLWQRTEKLQKLQKAMYRLQDKQNNRSLANSHNKSKAKLHKKSKQPFFDANSQFEYLQSQESSEYDFQKFKKRRRTEVPSQIEMMISKTMGMKPTSKLSHKYY